MSSLDRFIDTLLPPTELIGADAAAEAGWAPDAPDQYCSRCGATAHAAAVTETGCPHCRDTSVPWHGVWRLGAYRPPLAEWVVRFKFRGAWGWGEWFGRRLAERTPDLGPSIVTPVPLHTTRRLVRGYDQAALIARAFAAEKRLPFAPLLRRRRPTAAQSRLTNQEHRRRNVRNAFAARRVDLTGWTVWLIDDVKTSGSTAHACTRLLKKAGAARVHLAVPAVADPRGSDFQRS